jgi:hypothetical protein
VAETWLAPAHCRTNATRPLMVGRAWRTRTATHGTARATGARARRGGAGKAPREIVARPCLAADPAMGGPDRASGTRSQFADRRPRAPGRNRSIARRLAALCACERSGCRSGPATPDCRSQARRARCQPVRARGGPRTRVESVAGRARFSLRR